MKLLIVDDNATNLKLLRAQLETSGHAVVQAGNGVEALRALHDEPMDGVISDILMPEMDGFRLCLELRNDARYAELPLLLYTSTYDSPADRDLARTVGADAYLTKPAPTQQILDALGQARERKGKPRNIAPLPPSETQVLRQYNEALVRKLEEKNGELVKTNEQLRESERFARATLDALSSHVAILDELGVIIGVNQSWRQFALEHEGTDYLQVCDRAALAGDAAARRFGAAIRAMMSGNRDPWSFEQSIQHAGTEHWFVVRLTHFSGEAGTRVVIAREDVTQRRRAEGAVRTLNESLERRVAERTRELQMINSELEATNRGLEAFSYTVSHDLRNPLAAIDGLSALLQSQHVGTLSDKGLHFVSLMRLSVKNMAQLIDDLLRLARTAREPIERRRVDLEALVRECVADFHDEIERRHIKVAIDHLPVIEGDAALLRQVFVNLLGNAVKYTRHQAQAAIEVGYRTVQGQRVIDVKDNGAGFDMQYADKLFGVFQRLHRQDEFEGTGVGLAIVQRIVQRHGGRIWADASPGHGAAFHFTLEDPPPSRPND